MTNLKTSFHASWCGLSLMLGLAFALHTQSLAEEVSTSLQNSDGSQYKAKAYYPKFSWEKTPQYFMFGDTQRTLTPEEVKSIAARTDFLCIEKSHGMKELGAAELGAKHEAAVFKKLKPGTKVLFYFNSAYAYPFTSYAKDLTRSKIDQRPDLKKFLLIDPKTGELAHRRNVFQFDVLNPEFRTWWVNTVAKGVAETGCDGAFIDQMHGFSWLRPNQVKEVRSAMGEMMAALKKKMGPDKILLANNAHQRAGVEVLPVVDANMFEHYDAKLLTKEMLLKDWNDMLKISKAGKMSIFRIGVEYVSSQDPKAEKPKRGPARTAKMAALAKEQLEYFHACYLIGAQPYSYFQYGWGWTLSDGSLHEFPSLQKPLGAPKGAYTRVKKDGWEFTREFERASVWVDTEKKQAKITWK
ncbi:hypothetical protein NT6N_09160 [Oceaniferula spumae]|uniref:Glycoside hydrolase family 10 protein n=1 Tax=Oceaniferula spumae TaxID=2979115 RepID=A0AAT9FIV6_9BACT